jgi:hypothetical protein
MQFLPGWIRKVLSFESALDPCRRSGMPIYTNNDPLMKAVLSDRIQADLLSWAEQKTENRISDIRNYDDKLIFAVTGTLKKYEEYTLLLDTACRFYDAVTNVVSDCSKVLNDIEPHC